MKQKIRCANRECRCLFIPNPRVKNHRYCNKEYCQRVKRRHRQRKKMKNDPQYQADQRESQQCWIEQNPDYWERYRNKHPEYVKRNRLLQKQRDQKRRSKNLAKMDALSQKSVVKTGRYYLIPDTADLAKMDAKNHNKYLLVPILQRNFSGRAR